jgi:transposase, IS30 family
MKQNKKQKKNTSKTYSHIIKSERLEIAILLDKKYSQRDIAKVLNRSVSSISSEINNNSVNGAYDPIKAEAKSKKKRKDSKHQGMKVANDLDLRGYVEERLKEDWSPEEIAGRLRNVDTNIKYVSHLGVYKFIYSPYGNIKDNGLVKYLRYRKKKSKRYRKGRSKLEKLQDRVFIDSRPDDINDRVRYGDWEGDFIVSGKNGSGVLLVLHERKSRYIIIEKIMSRKTSVLNSRVKEITGGYIEFKSLTLDNDISFRRHKELSNMLSTDIYFCHPYHSWEKGAVENSNKLIRQYVPKKSDISKYEYSFIKSIEWKLNNRPRKCLNYKTPLEIMVENDRFLSNKYFNKLDNILKPLNIDIPLKLKNLKCSA